MGYAGRLDRARLLDLEVADVLEQPLAVPEQDRDEVQLELVDQPGGQVLLDQVGASCEQRIGAARDFGSKRGGRNCYLAASRFYDCSGFIHAAEELTSSASRSQRW